MPQLLPLPLTPLLLLLSCSPRSTPSTQGGPAGALAFVRHGVVTTGPAPDGARTLPDGSHLVERAWQPGESVELGGLSAIAPARAECVPLFQVDLGDVSRLVAMGGEGPDTALAWSPGEGARVAVGTANGEVLVVDGWTGEVVARRTLAEARIREVAWSPNGGTLYAAEQSPDAMLRALDPDSLDERWHLRLADRVGSSTPPAGEDIYGVYSLPGGYSLSVLPGGDLLLAATHAWTDAEGRHRNQSQLLRIDARGQVAAAWPEQPAEVTLLHLRADPDGQRVAVTVGHSADGAAPAGLPVNGAQLLSLPALQPVLATQLEPLKPWFTEASVWEALDLSSSLDALFMGFNDGRVRILGLDGRLRGDAGTGAPVMAGDVPIQVGIGWGALVGDGAVFTTSTTRIPWGAASPDLRPPSVHPAENTVQAIGLDGSARWSWSGGQALQGMSVSPDGDELLVGAGERASDIRRDLYGGIVLSLEGPPERSGADRLQVECSTQGPVFFRHGIAADGRVALAEYPYRDAQGAVVGAYRLAVFR